MPRKISAALNESLRPNVYAVLHLNRQIDGEWGTREIYRDELVRTLGRLSRRVRGERIFRRLPKGHRLLPNAVSLEMVDDLPHLNLMLRRPDRWSFDNFREALFEEWFKSQWAAQHGGATYCEPAEAAPDLVRYCHKEGDLALIHETLTF